MYTDTVKQGLSGPNSTLKFHALITHLPYLPFYNELEIVYFLILK